MCFCAVTAYAQMAPGAAEHRYQLADRGVLLLAVPGDWKEQVSRPDPKAPPTIAYGAQAGQPFEVQVTPSWIAAPNAPKPTPDDIKRSVAKAAEELKGQAVEKSFDPIELKGPSARGYYVKATDRAPKPGEYKYVTQGMVALGEIGVTFTILTNDGQAAIVDAALQMVRDAKVSAR
jgi:hypothetical protein